MERLEAALEKAREKRREAGIDDRVIQKHEGRPAEASSVWSDLTEITISTRVARNNRITAISNGPLSGPYDMLRSRALHSMNEHGWKKLAITSPTVGCGKSTVAVNLALSLSRQHDLKIVAIDMDLRRPALHKAFGHRTASSLSEVIEGTVAITDHFVRYGDNLMIGLNTKPARNPSELLQSQSTKDFLAEMDGSLWFASAAVPQMTGVGEDEGKTGLFRLDVSSGTITKSAILPQYEKSQVLGDLIIADDNTIYATDSLTGAIYSYYIDSNEFEILVQRGKLGSPQGLALDESGNYLYVADYIGGLYRVWLHDGSLVRLDVADDTTAYGIDGLYRYGDELIVIQNGIRPNRVAALQMSDNGLAITSSRLLASNLEQFDEPTLGVIRGDDFYFVANSHWNRFDRENQLPEGLTGPLILKLALD